MLTAAFGGAQSIADSTPRSAVVGDINLDGRPDLLTADTESVVWHENQVNADGELAFSPNILLQDFSAHSVNLADLDGDSDLDVLIAGGPGEPNFPDNSWEVVWHENLDGNGTFSEAQLIGESNWFWLGELQTADMDNDGDLDVLLGTGGGLGGGAVSWFENDGGGNFVDEHPVLAGESIAHIEIHDLDNDGDQDAAVLFSTDFNWMLFAWYENSGNNTDFEQHEIHQEFSFPQGGLLMDVDNDGDLDSVWGAGGLDNERIAWNENVDGQGAFAAPKVLWDSSDEEGFVSIAVLTDHDIDGDGDTDLVFRVKNELRLLENVGDGTFVQSTIGSATRDIAEAVDLDGDADPDLLASAQDGLVWFENESNANGNNAVGDFDGDGEVNFADFLVLSANFGRESATADEGDLTNDGVVDFEDFLLFAANFGRQP